MLGSHDFRFEDPVKAIKELDELCATMWKYGMVSDFVLGSIYQVFGRLHEKELKKLSSSKVQKGLVLIFTLAT